ncbi:Protein of unknown function (DUF742) [Actinoalloteichus cyanogriseus DSM 43889]|uniref:DUF742 domain-containing protein n=1 Tax=Actinoalloteichus caeruleus DSM 43889 TaxID=1120930 RepID=A0ABT1JQ48_ACTCY|nr:Protein of unknown function (DUF742) [Actinoalloteichus caeruleus DSM 43889]
MEEERDDPPFPSGDPVGTTGARFAATDRRREPGGPRRDVVDTGDLVVSFEALHHGRSGPTGTSGEDEPAWPSTDWSVDPEATGGESSSLVRPYAWTRGRTRAREDLRVETLVSVSDRDESLRRHGLTREYRGIIQLCSEPLSVAEVAARLAVPLGVAKVLLGDMAETGSIVVHPAAALTGRPDTHLMLRVLDGLRRL